MGDVAKRAIVLTLFVTLAFACGIDAVGTSAVSSQTLPEAGTLGADGSVADARACRSITTGVPGSIVATKVAAPPIIDGDLSEWSSCFVALDSTNAYSVRNIAGTGNYPSGEFSVVHDGTKIYVAVRMEKVGAPGDQSGTSLFLNDSAELYFDADGTLAQTYGADTLQIVVDHTGRHQGFRMSTAVESPAARSASRIDGSKITLELEVTPATFGQTSFGKPVGFDVAFNDGDGTSQLTQIVWFQKCRKSTGCGCANGNDAPYCDGRQFGSLMLEP